MISSRWQEVPVGAIFAHFFSLSQHFTFIPLLGLAICPKESPRRSTSTTTATTMTMEKTACRLVAKHYYHTIIASARAAGLMTSSSSPGPATTTQSINALLAGCTRGLSGNKRNEANGGRLERESLAQELIFAISLTGTYGWGLLYCVS